MEEKFKYILSIYQWINGKKTTIERLNSVEELTVNEMDEKLNMLANTINYYTNLPQIKFVFDQSIIIINKTDGPIKIEMEKVNEDN